MPNYENILFKTKESGLRDVHHGILSVKAVISSSVKHLFE